MKRIVLTFGLIAGAILSLMLAISTALVDRIDIDKGFVIGLTMMVMAFLMIYFGIRQYRDTIDGGSIGFGRAFKVGILIALVTSLCYVVTWEVIYFGVAPEHGRKMVEHSRAKVLASDKTPSEIAAELRKLEEFQRKYEHPAFNAAITFTEVFPVGFVMTLVSAGLLSRRRRPSAALAGVAG